MSWKLAIAVSLLTAVVTAIVTIIVATYVAQRYGVSDRDGGRSMSIFFLLAPVAFILGFVLGLVGTNYMGATAWAQFWPATGASLGMAMVLILLVAGYFMLAAPVAQKTEEAPFIVQVEVRIPLDRIPAHPEEHSPMQITLNSGPDDTFPLTIDTAHSYRKNGNSIVSASADLHIGSTIGVLSLFIDENNWLELQNLPLVLPADSADRVWSELMPMQDMRVEEPRSSVVQARVRVVKR